MARGFILYGYPPRHVMEAVLGFETFVRARARAPVERARAAPGIIHDACVKLAAMRVAPRGATLTAAFMASRAPEGAGARARAGARPLEDIAAAVVAGDAVAFFVLLRNCPRLYARGARPGSWEVVAVVRALFPHVSPAHFQLVQLVLGEACALALLADIVWPAGGALDAEGAINTQLVQAVAAQLCAEVPRSVEALVRPPGRRFSRPDEFGARARARAPAAGAAATRSHSFPPPQGRSAGRHDDRRRL